MKAVNFLLPREFCAKVIREMAVVNEMLENIPDKTSTEDCQNLEKILSAVVKKRKTVPTKCMEINNQILTYELQRLESAKVVLDGTEEKDKFRKAVEGFRRLDSFQFSLEDLHEAEQRLEKYFERLKEINTYLEKRKNLAKAI